MVDRKQLTQLVLERHRPLTLYARQWLDAASADDAVQDTLAALLSLTAAPDDPVAWTYRALRNAAIDRARSARRRTRREQTVASERREWFEQHSDNLLDARTAESLLRDLPSADRELVVLRIWGDLTFAQIASITRCSTSEAHKRYTAALSQLRKRMETPCKPNPT